MANTILELKAPIYYPFPQMNKIPAVIIPLGEWNQSM